MAALEYSQNFSMMDGCMLSKLWTRKFADLNSFVFLSFPVSGNLTVHDIKRSHQVISHHSEAGDGGEAQRHQH